MSRRFASLKTVGHYDLLGLNLPKGEVGGGF